MELPIIRFNVNTQSSLTTLKEIGNENFYFLYPLNLPTEYLIFSFCALSRLDLANNCENVKQLSAILKKMRVC